MKSFTDVRHFTCIHNSKIHPKTEYIKIYKFKHFKKLSEIKTSKILIYSPQNCHFYQVYKATKKYLKRKLQNLMTIHKMFTISIPTYFLHKLVGL